MLNVTIFDVPSITKFSLENNLSNFYFVGKIEKNQDRQLSKNLINDVTQNKKETALLTSHEREKILNEINDIICDLNNLLKQSILATLISEKENKDRISMEKKRLNSIDQTNKNEEKNESENNVCVEEYKSNRNSKDRSSGNGTKLRKSKEDVLSNVRDTEWVADKESDNNFRNKDKKKVRRNSRIKGSKLDDALHDVISSIISGRIKSLFLFPYNYFFCYSFTEIISISSFCLAPTQAIFPLFFFRELLIREHFQTFFFTYSFIHSFIHSLVQPNLVFDARD